MKKVSDLHNEAMGLVDQALVAKLGGELDRAKELLYEAFKKERAAASIVTSKLELEPTRSVLYRSAASLALECGELREAERLISTALSGQPPEGISEELRDLLEQVYFERHLKIRGITLNPNEFQLSMSGQAVGLGITNSTQFVDRVKNIEAMVYRTSERLSGKSFRERGRPEKKQLEEIELYISIPRAASFAVSFRIGSGTQIKLPGMDFGEKIIDELFECFDLFNSTKTDPLKEKIRDLPYYRNFIGLARNIAPDGEQIRTIGFTTFRKGITRSVILTTPRKQVSTGEEIISEIESGKSIQVIGSLLFADARKGKRQIQLIADDGVAYKVHVPEGMMSDIVKPLWEQKVTVTGILRKNVIYLQDIEKVND